MSSVEIFRERERVCVCAGFLKKKHIKKKKEKAEQLTIDTQQSNFLFVFLILLSLYRMIYLFNYFFLKTIAQRSIEA